MDTKLINNWSLLLDEIAPSSKWEEQENLLSTITNWYGDGKHVYHTLEHVEHMLTKIDELTNIYLQDKPTLKLATWYHDIYYDPFNVDARLTNEFFSSVIARRELKELPLTDKTIIYDVEHLILLTKNHKIDLNLLIPKIIQEIFLDADMAILGESPELYKEYSDKLKKEYLNPGILPDSMIYYAKRKEFLRKVALKNEHIFYTDYMRDHYEEQARRNIIDEFLKLDKLIEETSRRKNNEYF